MKYIFFGAGKIGRLLGYIMKGDLAYYCDNYCQDDELNGVPIISFDEMQKIFRDYEVIITMNESNRASAIQQMEDANIPYRLIEEMALFQKRGLWFYGKNEGRRDAWVQNKLASVPQGRRILDAGAGEQKYKKYCAHLEYVSQDFCQYDGKGDGHGGQVGVWDTGGIDIVSDITQIPEGDASFDAILCTEVFEHIEAPEKAVMEFARLSRGGGQLILTAPFCSLTHFAPYHFMSGFNRYWYESVLPKYGFEIQELETNGSYFEYLAVLLWDLIHTASKYSQYTVSEKEVDTIIETIELLRRIQAQDKGSSETWCFGYHVLAVKK